MASGGFAARGNAQEGQYFNTEGNLAVMRHLERLVEQVRPPCRRRPQGATVAAAATLSNPPGAGLC